MNKQSNDTLDRILITLSMTIMELLRKRDIDIGIDVIKKEDSQTNYLTVKQIVEKYPFLTEGNLRWILRNKDKNGFSEIIRYLGSKILINEELFLKWIDEKGKK